MAEKETPKPKVYLETSFISYLTSRLARNVIVRGNQEITRRWWADRREDYWLQASELVVKEAERGNRKAAASRRAVLQKLTILKATDLALALANQLVLDQAFPEKAIADATHVAIAAAHGIQFLMTWNCTHLANARLRDRIESVCVAGGYQPPVICTPLELL